MLKLGLRTSFGKSLGLASSTAMPPLIPFSQPASDICRLSKLNSPTIKLLRNKYLK